MVQIESIFRGQNEISKMMNFVFDTAENIVGKGEMLVTSILSFSNTVFKMLFTQGHQKLGLCGKELICY